MSRILSAAKISCTAAGCDFKTSQKDYLRRHVRNRHEPPKFKCEFCGKLMSRKVVLETHLKWHTGELLPCTVCDFKTAYVSHMKAHIQMHELGNEGIDRPKADNTHKCQLCDYVAPSEARVVQHARVHFDELPYACSVPGCGHRTKWKGNLKQHEDRHDPMKNTRFQCPMCPKRFCTEYQVTRHVRTHTQERPRECPDCDYRAASLVQVKRHQQRHHFTTYSSLEDKEEHVGNQINEAAVPDETRHSLHECQSPAKINHRSPTSSFENSEKGNDTEGQRSSSVSFEPIILDFFPSKPLDSGRKDKRKANMGNKPRRIYIYPRNNICNVCGFATSRNLKDHMKTHSDDKPFHCQAPGCNFQTRWQRCLEGHVNNLHTPKKYRCPLEGCDFESKDLILNKKHRRLHKLPLIKNLQCPLCPKKYGTKDGLDNHVLCHTGEKAFKCELCEYKAKTSHSVRAHFKAMHPQ